jgi:hypothetical protein
MWMSFMTSGVKILDDPNMYFLLSAGARDRAASPVAVRLTAPLPFVPTSALACFALAFTGFLLPVFFAGFLAMRTSLLRHPGECREPLISFTANDTF